MIMNSSYLLVSDSNVWVLGGFSFILAQKINDGNMEINHTPTFIIEPRKKRLKIPLTHIYGYTKIASVCYMK